MTTHTIVTDPASPEEVTPGMLRRVAAATAIGTAVEWYDFFIYGTAAALVFNKLFFPSFEPLVGTLAALSTYAVGFIARPLGGVVFGHIGDKVGRKGALVATLLIVGIGTFLIGLMPTYERIGMWAPIGLVLIRLLQGFGVGGEQGNAILIMCEHAPPNQRGFYGSWVQIGAPAGFLLPSGLFAILTATQSEEWLIPLAPADQHPVGGGLEGEAQAEETVEGGGGCAAAVEPEHELVQVGLEVPLAQAVVDAQGPPLRVREDAVDPGQHRVRRRVADHPRVVLDVLEPGVAGPAVTDDRAAGRDVTGDEAAERDRRVVVDHREPDPARPLALDLDRARDQELAVVRSAGPGRLVPGAKGQAGLVHLDQAGQGLPVRVDHCPAQLAEQQPGRLAGAEPELEPQLPGRHPVLVRRHRPGGQEPGAQRQVAAVQRRAGGDRDLTLAGRALERQPLAGQLPGLIMAASRAAEPARPALLEQPAGAGGLVGKPGLELRQRSGQLGHPISSHLLRHNL